LANKYQLGSELVNMPMDGIRMARTFLNVLATFGRGAVIDPASWCGSMTRGLNGSPPGCHYIVIALTKTKKLSRHSRQLSFEPSGNRRSCLAECIATPHHRPSDARELVCDSDGHDTRRPSRQQRVDPRRQLGLVPSIPYVENGARDYRLTVIPSAYGVAWRRFTLC
jgi:hypothetical protein